MDAWTQHELVKYRCANVFELVAVRSNQRQARADAKEMARRDQLEHGEEAEDECT